MIQDISVSMCEVQPFLMSCPANLASSPPKEGGWQGGAGGDGRGSVYFLKIKPSTCLT